MKNIKVSSIVDAVEAAPSLDFLHTAAPAADKAPQSELETKGKILMDCLSNFSIHGELIRITPGPVVSMFAVRLKSGVPGARIENLSADLARMLKAVAVRIQAPIPGTDMVGIEIPNEMRETVCLQELLSSQAFAKADSLLTLALGKDSSGQPFVADLAGMPHLLMAGATGTGKSVCIQAILLSLLYKARPDEVKLLLFDFMRVELSAYNDLPHLAHPVVTEMSHAKNALAWAVSEMDRRYAGMARLGVRSIVGYNEKLKGWGDARPPEFADLYAMPYLVIVIDEFADIMFCDMGMETLIVQLAQSAGAAGIHLILATQCLLEDVFTARIKANTPCRIAFQVSSKYDSRRILDANGAENLLGNGDMLFKPGCGRLHRLHGAFVSDDAIAAVVEYWKKQQKPEYTVDFSAWGNSAENGLTGDVLGDDDVAVDPMYREAVEFVRQQGKVSISLIQRRFRIGFNKAARFAEHMEKDGILQKGIPR